MIPNFLSSSQTLFLLDCGIRHQIKQLFLEELELLEDRNQDETLKDFLRLHTAQELRVLYRSFYSLTGPLQFCISQSCAVFLGYAP